MSGHELTKEQALSELIKEGIASYLDANYALNTFRDEILSRAAKVLQDKIELLAAAMGGEKPKRLVAPNLSQTNDGSYAWIGAYIALESPASNGCYLGLEFERGADQRSTVFVTFVHELYRRDEYSTIRGALARFPESLYYSDSEKHVGIRHELRDHAQIDANLTQVMEEIIALWQKLGGWKSIVSTAA
jgi:hypothetical protein